jgi:hypothetical protein
MQTKIYDSIDEIGAERIDPLEGSPVDFSYGLLRVMERSLWGDIRVRYVCVEAGEELLGMLPVYIGTNIEFMALMPVPIKAGYAALVEHMGLGQAYGVAVAGSLISDRGFIPLRPGCDRNAVLDAMIAAIDRLAEEHRLHLAFIKDVHQDFPGIDRFRSGGFVECYSLPTVSVDTSFGSRDEYIARLTPNGRSNARRVLKNAAREFKLRFVPVDPALVSRVYPLMRATYLKAPFKLEELPPRFISESVGAAVHPLESEMLLCERGDRLVGAFMIYFYKGQQLNKRVGIDYSDPQSPLIYNALNMHCLLRAAERSIPLSYLGQTSYTPKVRLGGRLENQHLFIRGYRLSVRLSLPLQRWWNQRFRADGIESAVKQGG